MRDAYKSKEDEVEAEIFARRSAEERVETREMTFNALLLVALLLTSVLLWKFWGESGFKGTYERVIKYAEEQAAIAQRTVQRTSPAPSGPPAASTPASSTTTPRAAPAPSSASSSAPLPVPVPAPSSTSGLASPSEIAAAIGQSGDAYGGANALFSALVASFAAWAGYLQFRALRKAQRAYQDERDENRREKYARKTEEQDRQVARFESHFFQLLDLVREARERIAAAKIHPNKEPKSGSAALDAFANTIYKEIMGTSSGTALVPISARDLTYHYQILYNRRPSVLGPYFRLLFQTFKFLSRADLDSGLVLEYARIARGQMSDGSVLLLALNGMSREGHAFVEFIEEFGLLEHMLEKYKTAFEPHLAEAYRHRAFIGSEERARPEHAHNPIIGFADDIFHWTDEQLKDRAGMRNHQYVGIGDDAED